MLKLFKVSSCSAINQTIYEQNALISLYLFYLCFSHFQRVNKLRFSKITVWPSCVFSFHVQQKDSRQNVRSFSSCLAFLCNFRIGTESISSLLVNAPDLGYYGLELFTKRKIFLIFTNSSLSLSFHLSFVRQKI